MVKFLFPVDGDFLNANDGREQDGRLYVTARLLSTGGVPTVNGVKAVFDAAAQEYRAELTLDGWRNTVTAVTPTGEAETIGVFRLRDAVGYYQLFIDDGICFLRDLTRNQDRYQTVWDNPFLGFLKSMYDKYGTLTHIHVYYETCTASPDWGNDRYTDRFDLSMMPEKFKDSFREASRWLRMTFHARADKPDWPHVHATYEDTLRDYDLVTNEIIRFAGSELLSPATDPHWNEMSVEAARALRTRGMRIINNLYQSAQYQKDGIPAHMQTRDFWYDRKEDIICARTEVCLNRTPTEEIAAVLDEEAKNPGTAGFVYLLIHEQYFYADYCNYLPDYKIRVENGIRWCAEHGYRSRWMEDIILQDRLS